MELVSKKAAKLQGLSRYFTGKPCNRGHISARFITGHCIECKRLKAVERYNQLKNDDPDRIKKRNFLQNKKSQNRRRKYDVNARKENPEKFRIKDRKYYLNNTEKKKEHSRIYAINNTAYILAKNANYRAAKLKRTPLWLSKSDKREIELIYKIATRVSKETGIDYHVDHKIPLQGDIVSGLHIPDNLQLLKASENLSKGNRFAVN